MENSRSRCIAKLNELNGIDHVASVNNSMRLTYDSIIMSGDLSNVNAIINNNITVLGYPENQTTMLPQGDTEFKNKRTVFNSDSISLNTNSDRYGFTWNGKSMNPELLDTDDKFIVKMSQNFINNLFTIMKNFEGLNDVTDKDVKTTNVFVSPKEEDDNIFKFWPLIGTLEFKGILNNMEDRRKTRTQNMS
jgi:hypothetical protein